MNYIELSTGDLMDEQAVRAAHPNTIFPRAFAPPDSTVCHWAVTNLATGAVAFNTISGGAAVLPQESTLLAPWGYRTNNSSGLPVAIDVMSAYIETDF